RRLELRTATRAVADASPGGEAPVGQEERALEGQPARGLVREGSLALHRRQRRPLQRATRSRLRLDRLHPLHAAGNRTRGPLVAERQGRVRPPLEVSRYPRRGGMSYEVAHLRALESEAIHVMREVAAELERA